MKQIAEWSPVQSADMTFIGKSATDIHCEIIFILFNTDGLNKMRYIGGSRGGVPGTRPNPRVPILSF